MTHPWDGMVKFTYMTIVDFYGTCREKCFKKTWILWDMTLYFGICLLDAPGKNALGLENGCVVSPYFLQFLNVTDSFFLQSSQLFLFHS